MCDQDYYYFVRWGDVCDVGENCGWCSSGVVVAARKTRVYVRCVYA